ncbi:MAG: NnrS family protein [Gammaproteobacteria bacterium]|nr:NnrS family protein [Gammaproteobacteria bacterium]NIR83476.1 NnrS family protein [Gammaproteobacteria bacterium]NIR91398.1 NnrS family protein [Gammaproteobacteria bacterium]NIU04638.1 NnrS family protein [Gammaproteobacteria bacterium]NIV51680.1 NnrS family protein [Gammaproteobacteria bacterium]
MGEKIGQHARSRVSIAGAPVLGRGFRPFYLCAGILATLWMPLWLGVLHGVWRIPARVDPLTWHAHEMIYGFAVAVMAGFLLTAVRNWTGRPTPVGAPLATLVVLWLAGRIAMLLGAGAPAWVVAGLDGAFLPALALILWVPLWRTRSRRNMVFVGVLLALATANLWVHLAAAGAVGGTPRQALRLALDLILFVMVVIGGRVIPMFTANALPRVRIHTPALLDRLAPLSVLLVLAAHAFTVPQTLAATAALLAAAANGLRMAGWASFATRRSPILWILHAGYAWIVLSLALEALALAGIASLRPLSVHALTVGAIGSLTLGMMTRSALGHTGRPLVADRTTAVAYACVNLAAGARVLVPIAFPGLYLAILDASGILWSVAFGAFLVGFWPALTRPRVDGKPG